MSADVLAKLEEIFRDVFEDASIVLRDETVADDIEGWDSESHVRMVVVVEEAFGIRFANREITAWQNAGDIRRSIERHLA